MRQLFDQLVRPMATTETVGAFREHLKYAMSINTV